MGLTNIAWTATVASDGTVRPGYTMNFWLGCTAVSPACDHCYADALITRYGGNFAQRKRTAPQTWRKPLSWNSKAKAEGRRWRVFTLSLGDFWDNQVPAEWRMDALDVIRQTDGLDWLLLTKRPQNIHRMLVEARDLAVAQDNRPLVAWLMDWLGVYPPPNVWLGCTAENQTEADRRLPILLRIPAAVHFCSYEPALGPIDFRWLDLGGGVTLDALTGHHSATVEWVAEPGEDLRSRLPELPKLPPRLAPLDWVIWGGESGPGYRMPDLAWARATRDQCRLTGTAFFMKQTWGASQRSMQPIPDDLMVRQWPEPALEAA